MAADPQDTAPIITIGIDVGGHRKGFHAVALLNGAYAAQLASCEVQELAHWCQSVVQASVIAIDAPCRWSIDGRARPCERELMQKGIWCFSSPTHQKAHTPHRTGYFDWMLQGEKLYQALEVSHPLACRLPIAGPGCLETFPHAITWHLCDGKAKAPQKRRQRRELLQQAGIDLAPLTNIDWVDAALCALTAHRFASGAACSAYGEPESGLIVVPERTSPSGERGLGRPNLSA
jgi:predicted nuclease with RNAse H fold